MHRKYHQFAKFLLLELSVDIMYDQNNNSCNIFIHPPKNSKQKDELDVEFETVVIYNKMLPIVCSNFLLIQRHLKNC